MTTRIRTRLAKQTLRNSLTAWVLAGMSAMVLAQTGPGVAAADSKAAKQAAQEQAHAKSSAQRQAEHSEIAQKRSLIEQQQTAAEALCYQKFAVEDCLQVARRLAREQDAPLRARELEINEAERREKAADRLRSIEEKKAEKAATPMKSQQREPKSAGLAPQPTGSGAKPALDEAAAQAVRQTEAQQRAAKQADYVRRHSEDVSRREADNAARAAKSRADYDAKIKAAAERKAQAEQAAKERGKTAAPLPPPPAN